MDPRLIALNTTLAAQQKAAEDLYQEMEAKSATPGYAAGEYNERLEKIITDGKATVKSIQLIRDMEQLKSLQTVPGEAPPQQTPQQQVDQKAYTWPNGKRKSWGHLYTESAEYKSMVAQSGVRSMGFNVKAGGAMYGSNDTYGGALVVIDRQKFVADIAPYRELALLDLVGKSSTQSDSVEYVRVIDKTLNADFVPERNSGDTDFGTKPSSDFKMDIIQEMVKTIAHWVPASRQILMDAPQIRSYIDNFLTDGLWLKLEAAMLNGAGGTGFTGILQTLNILSRQHKVSGRAFSANDTIADTLRRALTDIQLSFFEADGIFLHPTQGESLELLKDDNKNYLNVYDPVQQRLWRKPVITSQVIADGTGLVGNFRQGCILWDRMLTEIRIGEPNNFFLQNAVAILAELRAAFGVIYPAMFEKVTLLNT